MINIKILPVLFILIFSFCTINVFAQKRKVLKYQNKGTAFYKQDNFESAIEYYNKALKKGEPNFDILYLKGMSYYYLEQYESAINSFDLALKYNTKDYRTYFYKGACLDQLDQSEAAIKEYQIALKKGDRDVHALIYSNIGNSLSKQLKHEEAINAHQRAIKLEEGKSMYYYNLAKAYSEKGDYAKAIEINKITVSLDAKYTKAYNNMGMCYLLLKNYRQSIKMLKTALELYENKPFDSTKAYTYNNLAFCYLNINMLDKAIEYAEKSKALDSENSYLYFTLAGIAAFKNDQEDFYNKLIKADELGFPLENRLNESFLKPYLKEERFKSFLK